MKKWPLSLMSLVSLAGSLWLLEQSMPPGVTRIEVEVPVTSHPSVHGTFWLPPKFEQGSSSIKGGVLVCHGVTSNRGVMASLCKALAWNGYATLAFDFWGHGRSKVPFRWQNNEKQIRSGWQWLRDRLKEPTGDKEPRLVFLGHSMGAFCGGPALQGDDTVSAFVAMGALPGQVPEVPILVAMGRFEQLFDEKKARAWREGTAHVIVSPFSDHAGEPYDPYLIFETVRWIDDILGETSRPVDRGMLFKWTIFVATGALWGGMSCLAFVYFLFRQEPDRDRIPLRRSSPSFDRSLLYPLLARLLCIEQTRGRYGYRSRTKAWIVGLASGLCFCFLLSTVLNTHVWGCHPIHFKRFLMLFLVLPPFMAWSSWSSARMERIGNRGFGPRLLMACLGRVVPVLILAGLTTMFVSPFLGMMFGLLAGCCFIAAILYALVVEAVLDDRAGAMAVAVFFSWLMAYYFPLPW